MTEPVISVRDFRKKYDRFMAVDGISFDVQPGEIFGLLGPNGAGKTSTLECLEGWLSFSLVGTAATQTGAPIPL